MTTVHEGTPLHHRFLIIAALALVSYFPTLRLGFLWDDHVVIEANSTLREWTWQNVKHDFTTDVADGHGDPYYRPAQTLLDRVNYSISGLRPFGYHLTNLLGHGLNAILVMELAIALGLGNLIGLLAGCMFAVHPIGVEQLMICAGRAEIYGLTFMLISLLFLLRDEPWAWLLGYVSFAAAVLFKESGLIAPFLLTCLYLYQEAPRSKYWRLAPFPFLIFPYLVLRRSVVGALLPQAHVPYVAQFFFEAFPQVLLHYARLIFIPWNLHSHRMMPHLTHAWPLLLVLLVGIVGVMIRQKARLGLLGLVWFILVLLPKTPIMIYGSFTLDHWAYPASIGLFLPLAAMYARLWHGPRNPFRYWLCLTFFPLLIFWALMVHLNVALRGTDEKMFRWALNFTESHPIKYNLGILLLETGRTREALPLLEDVFAAYPEDQNNRRALARAWTILGHPKVGRLYYKDPGSPNP